jgi:hypothetical protein
MTDGHTEASQSPKFKVQNGGPVGRETTWAQRRTVHCQTDGAAEANDVRRNEQCYVLGLWFLQCR